MYKKYLLSLLFFIPFIIIFCLNNFNHHLILSPNDKDFIISPYSDLLKKDGTSVCDAKYTNGAFIFSYTLHNNPDCNTPCQRNTYAGFALDFKSKNLSEISKINPIPAPINISRYDFIRITIDSITPQTPFKVQLKTQIPGAGNSRFSIDSTAYIRETEIITKKGDTTYTRAIKSDFKNPDFMISRMGSDDYPDAPDYQRFYGFSFQTASDTKVDIPGGFSIKKIEFFKRPINLVLVFVLCFISSLICFLNIYYIRQITKRSHRHNLSDEKKKIFEKAKKMVLEKPERLIKDIAKDLDISESALCNIFTNQIGISPLQYRKQNQ